MDESVYVYSSRDLIFSVDGIWDRDRSTGLSQFDEMLCRRWDAAQQAGHFRYKLDDLETKVVGGKYRFVAQLNVKRAVDRRKPQFISSISQPYNNDDFNFTKVGRHEILFHIRKNDDSNLQVNGSSDEFSEENIKDGVLSCNQMIINVSPLEYGNSLFVPNVFSCLPQVLSLESIRMAIELVLCSSNKAFRAGFNSLCANASVNHHHFHVFYLNFELPVETVEVKQIIGECYEIMNYPASGFAFQLTDNNIHPLAKLIFAVANCLQSNNIAHNLFITRGTQFNSKDKDYKAVRIYLWARRSEFGSKDDTAFNIACCELSGHLPIKKLEAFQTIAEDEVVDVLSGACKSVFSEILPKVKKLLETF